MTFCDLRERALGQPAGAAELLLQRALLLVGEHVEGDVDAGDAVERATALATAVWKWLRIGQPGVVSETVTSTTPSAWMSIERTMSSSTMSRRSSGSMTALSASRI